MDTRELRHRDFIRLARMTSGTILVGRSPHGIVYPDTPRSFFLKDIRDIVNTPPAHQLLRNEGGQIFHINYFTTDRFLMATDEFIKDFRVITIGTPRDIRHSILTMYNLI